MADSDVLPPDTEGDRALRARVAQELARYFYRHLAEEQAKSSDVLDTPRELTGETPRAANERILAELLQAFPEVQDGPTAPFNLIEEWARRNRFVYAYAEYAFDLYNRIFLDRLLAFRDPSVENVRRFEKAAHSVFSRFDYTARGFSISFFIRVENNMRELLREISRTIPDIDHERAWQLLYEQSREYQEVVNAIFEKRLNDALDESERLLHNILPHTVAAELKRRDRVEPVHFPSATVLFTDFVGFTRLSEQLSPEQLVGELDESFSILDAIVEAHGLEKIKTIGDSYMCAGGLPLANRTHLLDTALAALEIRRELSELKLNRLGKGSEYWDVRIGFHTGPLVAGVVARKKFSYDIWGDTVNTASRMESAGEPGRINTSRQAFEDLQYFFEFTPRGMVEAKGKGQTEMYFLERLKSRFAADSEGTRPNEELLNIRDRIATGATVRFRTSGPS